MAIDAYLQIDGIKGESADSAHQGWIELISAHWGVTQPRSTSVSTAGGQLFAVTTAVDLTLAPRGKPDWEASKAWSPEWLAHPSTV